MCEPMKPAPPVTRNSDEGAMDARETAGNYGGPAHTKSIPGSRATLTSLVAGESLVVGSLPAYHRAEVRDALERHLRHEPTRASKSRIKRLRGLSQPQYRLRVGEVRVFYDVTREAVEILAIVTKAEAARWLAEHGTPSAPGRPG